MSASWHRLVLTLPVRSGRPSNGDAVVQRLSSSAGDRPRSGLANVGWSGIRRDFPLSGDGIKVPKSTVEVNLKPMLKEEVPRVRFHESVWIWPSACCRFMPSILLASVRGRALSRDKFLLWCTQLPAGCMVAMEASPAHTGNGFRVFAARSSGSALSSPVLTARRNCSSRRGSGHCSSLLK